MAPPTYTNPQKPRRKAILLPVSPEISSDEEDHDFFYRIARSKIPFLCPFSDQSRDNPCKEFPDSVDRKEVLMKHLLAIKNQGGDEKHSLDDDLWNDEFTKYLMMPRPGKYSEGKRRRSHKKAAHRAYQKKKLNEARLGRQYREQFDRGEITAEEYRKILTGANRRKFDEEQRVKRRVEEMQADNDRRLEQRLQQKITELRVVNARGAEDDRIQELVNLRSELNKKNDIVVGRQAQLGKTTSDVAEFFTSPGFIASNLSIFDNHNYKPPRVPSIKAFYEYATLLHPQEEWRNSDVYADAHIRRMKTALRHYVDNTKRKIASDEDKAYVEEWINVFNASCDEMIKDRDINEQRMGKRKEKWFEDQKEEWKMAQKNFFSQFPVGRKPMVQKLRCWTILLASPV